MIRPRALLLHCWAVITEARCAADFMTDSSHEKGFASVVGQFIPGGGRERAEVARVGDCA
jgi:hypothetical protein